MSKNFSLRSVILSALFAAGIASASAAETERPNVLWIFIEDWCPDLSCYGTKGISTPHVDALAAQGARYTNAFTTAPVCSTSRSAMMTGFHQNYIGANQHRTAKADQKPLPHGIRPIPQLLADAGYFTCLMDNKTDLNFVVEGKLFEGKDWGGRKNGQPFFAQMTFHETHRSWARDPKRPIDPKDVEIPPYYPDNEFTRRDWASGLEAMQNVDRKVGALLERLDKEGLAENTLVFFIGDHGGCMPRGKQFLYDGGLHVPLIVRWPGKVKPGTVADDLVTSLDVSRSVLAAAGVDPGYAMPGANLFEEGALKGRKYIFAARDKMDDTHDAMRAIRSRDFKLIHNLMPERAYCQFSAYKEAQYPTLALLNLMNLKGELTPEQAAFMAPTKPEYELFDLRADPYEVKNLADDPAHVETKAELLAELARWRDAIGDTGPTEAFRKGGYPAVYPTRSLEDWERTVEAWKPYVFRSPEAKIPNPFGQAAKPLVLMTAEEREAYFAGAGKKAKQKKKK